VIVFLLSTAPLELQRRIVNDAIREGAVEAILSLALLYVGVALAEGAIKLGLNIYRGWVSENAIRTLRDIVLALIGDEPPSGRSSDSRNDAEAEGVEVSMILSEAEPIGGFVGVSLSEPLLQGGILVSVFGYLAYLQPTMALISFIVFSPQMIFIPVMQRAINRRARARIRTLRALSAGIIGPNHRGDGPPAAAAADDAASMSAQTERVDRVFALNMQIVKLKFSMNFLMNLLHHSSVAGVLAVGGWYAVTGRIEVGTIVAFVSGLVKVNDPWGDIVNWFREATVVEVKYRLVADAVDVLTETSAASCLASDDCGSGSGGLER
jgi:ABC-type multidrug transport system fused ATPase/permease subunit